MSQYCAHDAVTMAVAGFVDSSTPPVATPGSPYAFGAMATPLAQFPAAPYTGAVLRYVPASQSVQWDDTRSTGQARSQRLDTMRQARETAIATTFTWDGSTFDADDASQTRIAVTALAATQAGYQPTPYRLADNTWRTLSAADALAVCAALQAHLRAQYDRFQQREQSINNAASKTAVDSVVW